MKTSVSQFEMLVNFMERHGDINKPNKNAGGRIRTIQAWERLTSLLNADATGESKTTEKWKKVWSDLKNNIKKKAAKINRAAGGTGGGPALQIKLTELEERVLSIMGAQAATGLTAVLEAGLPQEPNITEDTDRTMTLPQTAPHVETERPPIFSFQDVEEISLAHVRIIPETPDQLHIPPVAEPVHVDWNVAGTSRQTHVPPPAPETPPPAPETPPPAHQDDFVPAHRHPAQRGHTPRRPRSSPLRRARSPRRRLVGPHSHIEQATQHFLNSDEQWRNFLQKKHDDEVELEREKLRVRKNEIEAQHRWQEVALSAIAVLNKLIDSRLLRD